MPGYLLTSATQATCPHGAPVSFVPSQSSVLAERAPVLLVSDQATIAGCPFVVGTVASPCLTIQWLAPAARVMVTQTLERHKHAVPLRRRYAGAVVCDVKAHLAGPGAA